MQIKQLQAIALECRDLLKTIQAISFGEEGRNVLEIEAKIKERKIEIRQIRGELKELLTQQKKKKQLNKYIRAIEKQINSMRATASKEQRHYYQLQRLCKRLRQNLLDQKTKASKLVQEEHTLVEFEGYVEEGIQLQSQYDTLKQKLDELTKQSISQRSAFQDTLKSKKEWISEMDKNNAVIETKIQYLTKQIDVQEQVIDEINQLEKKENYLKFKEPKEKKNGQSFNILQKEAEFFFQRQTGLNVWEKHEVTNLLQRKQIQKQKQIRRIGSIFRQRFASHHSLENHKQDKTFNFSVDLRNLANKSAEKKFTASNPSSFISKDRMEQLEKNKRIRTRYTEPLHSQSSIQKTRLKTVVQDQEQQEAQKQSIISIYERLKKQRDSSHSIIKFKRKQNKRKIFQKSKGVPIEREHF